MAQAERDAWDDVAEAFRRRGGSEQATTDAVDALRTTKLRPAFVLEEIETRFPLAVAGPGHVGNVPVSASEPNPPKAGRHRAIPGRQVTVSAEPPDSATAVSDEVLNELVERIRVASFEAPKAGSHTEWAGRIKAMFTVVCAECGVSEGDHGDLGDFHESGVSAFSPLACYRPHGPDSSS